MTSFPMLKSNPFLSQWLSAANASAGALRGFWTAEAYRQQTALLLEFNRHAVAFWTAALMPPRLPAVQDATSVPTPMAEPIERLVEAMAPVATVPVPSVLAAPAVTPEPEAPLPIPAPAAMSKVVLPKAKKPAQQLRAARTVRKAPKSVAKRKLTRH